MEIQEVVLEQQSMRKRIGVLEQKQAVSDLLTQQSIETSKELSTTLKDFGITLVNISNSLSRSDERMEEMGKVISKIDHKVDCLEANVENRVDELEGDFCDKVSGLHQKIEIVEEKGKFDFIQYIKQNFIQIVIASGVAAYIITNAL